MFLGIVDISELETEAYFLLKSLSHSLHGSPEENINFQRTWWQYEHKLVSPSDHPSGQLL